MNKQTLLGLLCLTLSSFVCAEEFISNEDYERITSQEELVSDINESTVESIILVDEPIIVTIMEKPTEILDTEVITENESTDTNITQEESTNVEPMSYAKALEKAKNEGRVIMLMISANNCKYCDKMKTETLGDSSVIDKLDSDFITLHYNQDLEPLPLGLQEGMTPTFVFLNSNEDILNIYPGMRTPSEFKEVLEQILTQ